MIKEQSIRFLWGGVEDFALVPKNEKDPYLFHKKCHIISVWVGWRNEGHSLFMMTEIGAFLWHQSCQFRLFLYSNNTGWDGISLTLKMTTQIPPHPHQMVNYEASLITPNYGKKMWKTYVIQNYHMMFNVFVNITGVTYLDRLAHLLWPPFPLLGNTYHHLILK